MPLPSRLLLGLAILLGLAWGAMALWFRAPLGSGLRPLLPLLWILASCAGLSAIAGTRLRRGPGIVYGVGVLALAFWWSSLAPRAVADWSPDVSRPARTSLAGSRLTVHDLRTFTWHSDDDADASWEDRVYDLDALVSTDLFLSYWAGESIAHAMVSFGFADGRQLAWSFEVRRVKGEVYSSLAGFFRNNELVLVAADERDVIRVRTALRGEDVRIFKLRMKPVRMRELLLSYADRANELASGPEFYNTLTSSCATSMMQLVRGLDPRIPTDYRIALSGLMPGYLYDNHFVTQTVSLDALVAAARIGERARPPAGTPPGDPGFSQRIRQGVPGPS
jgi:hypothetical protein